MNGSRKSQVNISTGLSEGDNLVEVFELEEELLFLEYKFVRENCDTVWAIPNWDKLGRTIWLSKKRDLYRSKEDAIGSLLGEKLRVIARTKEEARRLIGLMDGKCNLS